MGNRKSCRCKQCQAACQNKPGWFLPGEAERAAEYLGLTLQEFFDVHLMVDWWIDKPPIFVLSPAITAGKPGEEFPSNPRGQCVFFKDGHCAIHAVKPFECREMIHDEPPNNRHQFVAEQWKDHQSQIRDLLKREPVTRPFHLADLLGGGRDAA